MKSLENLFLFHHQAPIINLSQVFTERLPPLWIFSSKMVIHVLWFSGKILDIGTLTSSISFKHLTCFQKWKIAVEKLAGFQMEVTSIALLCTYINLSRYHKCHFCSTNVYFKFSIHTIRVVNYGVVQFPYLGGCM